MLDDLHKILTDIVKNHDIIGIEDLQFIVKWVRGSIKAYCPNLYFFYGYDVP